MGAIRDSLPGAIESRAMSPSKQMSTSRQTSPEQMLPGQTPPRLKGQGGFSLIEILAAMAVFMLVSVSVLTGVSVVVRSDSAQQSRAAVTVMSQNYADALSDAPYVSCGATGDYSIAKAGLSAQTGTAVTIDSVRYWNRQPPPSSANPTDSQWNAAFGATCGSDTGLQRITYSVVSNVGGRVTKSTESALKRFNGTKPDPRTDPPPGGTSCVIAATDRVASTWVNETADKQSTNYSTGDGAGELNMLYLAGTRRFSYLRFNLTPATPCANGGVLPAGASILAAEVSLYTFNIGGAPACGADSCWHVMERVGGGQANSNWNQSTLTWANQPCPTGYGVSCQAGGTASTILFEHGTGAFNWGPRFQRIQATQLLDDVKSFYTSPTTNNGWVIKEACSQTYGKACGTTAPGFQMRSSRSADVAQRPTLTVYY